MKYSEIAVKKLEEAFSIDATVNEACFYAGISKQTLYNWYEKDPSLKVKLDRLRHNPVLKARQEVVKRIPESYQNAMDYLKRKRKNEFGDIAIGTDDAPLNINIQMVDNKDEHTSKQEDV